jgi:hypothetical protein
MVEVSATRCSFIVILLVSLVSFAATTLCVASQRVFILCCLFRYRLSVENFGYTLVYFTKINFNILHLVQRSRVRVDVPTLPSTSSWRGA